MSAPSASTPHDWLAEFPPPRSLALDQEAQRIYERAYAIGVKTEPENDPPITFSIVMVALLEGDDETSRWFAREAVQNGPNASKVLMEKQLDLNAVPTSSAPGRPTSYNNGDIAHVVDDLINSNRAAP